MNQPRTARDTRQIDAYLLTVSEELKKIDDSLHRLHQFTQLVVAASAPSEAAKDPLEQMYEDLERAIRRRSSFDPAREAESMDASSGNATPPATRTGRSRLVLLNSPSGHAQAGVPAPGASKPSRTATASVAHR